MGNETLIKVGKLNKTLDIMNRSWGTLVDNGLNLMKIHANAISKDDVKIPLGIKSDFLELV